ncbi:ECF transporter S component [Catelliglobosispora koreensis]|uniref:ECF transporter S component n=1 Tax=Catelliglobosispora koreensis TaxID=129052 RepID=UPI0003A22D5A|nr:ECF transporter S component [Catelliglobosispora koreensis]
MTMARWRTIDIVVASTLAVVFGVIFWALGLLWYGPLETAFAAFPPARAVVNGIWFIPAILAPLIIRKPGAALYTETVAAIVSMLFGSSWGWLTFWYGVAQGAAGELAFAATGYRRFNATQAFLGGALAGGFATAMDILFTSIGDYTTGWQWAYGAFQVGSGAIIAGLGSYFLAQALARTGVLDRFPIAKARELV